MGKSISVWFIYKGKRLVNIAFTGRQAWKKCPPDGWSREMKINIHDKVEDLFFIIFLSVITCLIIYMVFSLRS